MALQFALLDTQLHARTGIQCGVPALDIYLRQQAGQHQRDGIATTHVLTDDSNPTHILGYCRLAAAQLQLHDLQPPDRRRLPAYPVPTARLGRRAVAVTAQGQPLRDAVAGPCRELLPDPARETAYARTGGPSGIDDRRTGNQYYRLPFAVMKFTESPSDSKTASVSSPIIMELKRSPTSPSDTSKSDNS